MNEIRLEMRAVKLALESFDEYVNEEERIRYLRGSDELKAYLDYTEEELKEQEKILLQQEYSLLLVQRTVTFDPLNISMSVEIRKHTVAPDVPFTSILDSPLPFKIPVVNPKLAAAYPSLLECGWTEYESTVDQWLSNVVTNLGLTSGTAVTGTDMLWQALLATLCKLSVHISEQDPSSEPTSRPEFTALFDNMLVLKSESKNDERELPTAIADLIDKFHVTAHLMFPCHCPFIPGIASSRQLISLHRIYYDRVTGLYRQDLVKQYHALDFQDRLRFIVDIFKIAIWIVSQTTSAQFCFHLVTNVRVKTSNGHHVTLMKDGIVKEFHHGVEKIPIGIIKMIYDAKLPNVEQGIARKGSGTVTITTVGRRLRDLRSDELDKGFVFSQVQEAVRQLHRLGIAHCDICVDNVFVNVVDNMVFLGGLEYCRTKDAVPSDELRRADSRAQTAEELDLIQLNKFSDELASL